MFECLTLLKIDVIEMEKWAVNWLKMHSQRHRFFEKISGGGTPYPPGMTRKCKIIVRNKVFECLFFFFDPLARINGRCTLYTPGLTLVKIEVIEYGKMGFKMA